MIVSINESTCVTVSLPVWQWVYLYDSWRNDYPDDDPMYFERLHLDDNYSSDDDSEYQWVYLCDNWRFDTTHDTEVTFDRDVGVY